MKQWYFIHTYSGHENKVVESLHARIRDMGLADQITEVLLPKEKVIEMRGNKWLLTMRAKTDLLRRKSLKRGKKKAKATNANPSA